MHDITSIAPTPAEFDNVRRIDGFGQIKNQYPDYLYDESKLSATPFEHLFFPADEAELCAIVKEMGRRQIKVTIAAARTGLAGGCVPNQGALVSLENLNRITDLYYDSRAEEWCLRAQCAVSLRDLNRCARDKDFAPLAQTANAELKTALDRFRGEPGTYFYPPDPTETSASIGGTAATNASGARTFRYGPTRDWIRAIRVVLANGEILKIPRGKYFASPSATFCITDTRGEVIVLTVPDYPIPRTKSTAGLFAAPHMDLIDLFIGSEGTLGIITEIDVALLPQAPCMDVILFVDSDQQAVQLTAGLRTDKRLKLELIEFYSQHALDLLRRRQQADPQAMGLPAVPEDAAAALFIEFAFDPSGECPMYEALEEVLAQHGASMERSWAAYEPEKISQFRHFRHALPETVSEIIATRKKRYPDLHRVSADIAVPDACFGDMWRVYTESLATAGLEWLAYGHIGNNHVHVNVLPRDMDELQNAMQLYQHFARTAVGMGGTVSAEHGIGKLKSAFLRIMYDDAHFSQMRAIKEALDPQGLLSPGNLF